MGDKVQKKQVKKHPSNEKALAAKASADAAAKAAASMNAAKPAAKGKGK